MNKPFLLFVFLILINFTSTQSQNLLSALRDDTPEREFVKNAFKSTRVISSHSIEFLGGGVLDFRILHRFGRINGGTYEAFGLDQSRVRIGLDYGITKRLMFGIGRSSYKKESDAFIKYRLLWQSTGIKSIPLSIVLVSGITENGLKFQNTNQKNYFTSRLAFYHQVIIGRKFSEAFSFQIYPTLIHNNLVDKKTDKNDIVSIGAGTRIKLSKRIAFTADYYYQLPNQGIPDIQQPLSIGFDIETGGHVFQLHFTNALGMNERVINMETDGKWDKGDVHFGFNISRVFTIDKHRHKDIGADD